MQAYIHTCLYGPTYRYSHNTPTYIYAYIHTCIYMYLYIIKYPFIYLYIHTYIHKYIHTCMHAYINSVLIRGMALINANEH